MSRHIVVIGAGVIGLSVAYHCVKRGLRVTVLERSSRQRTSCSFGNMGIVAPSHFIPLAAPGMVALGLQWMLIPESPFYIKPRLSWDLLTWAFRFWAAATPRHVQRAAPLLRDLSLASRALFEDWDKVGPGFGLEKHGLLMLCGTEHGFEEETRVATLAQRLGIAAEVFDAAAVARLEPGVEMNIEGGVYFPGDCHLQPERFIAALEERVLSGGGEIIWNSNVAGWRCEERTMIAAKTSLGEVAGDEFVLCSGAWSSQMMEELNLRLPMQAGKGYSLTLDKPRQLPRCCAILTEARVAVTPMAGALRFGGTMEIAGMSEAISPRRVRGIVRAVTEFYPAFAAEDFEGIEPWAGLRPCSPDGLPYVGRTAAAKNLSVASGHAMLGLSLAPITAHLIGQVLADEPPEIDLTMLSPDRFA